jgi:hypothetical protein
MKLIAGPGREPRGSAGGQATLALLYLVAAFVIVSIVATEPISSFEPISPGAQALATLPFPRIAGTPVEQAVLVAGVVLALFATSNAIVRLVLTAAGTQFSPAEQRLRGGRIIGPIERVLIFGLGLAGEPTAAALVIGAKGLLRCPELSGLRRRCRLERLRPSHDRRGHRVPADRFAHELGPCTVAVDRRALALRPRVTVSP